MLLLMGNVMTCLCLLICVAFFTLLERKILGFIQLRKGPNKVSMWGTMQPFADALKLFLKENIIPYYSNKMLFIFFPAFSLSLALMFWYLYPSEFSQKFTPWGMMMFFCFMALNVYSLLGAGWVSNSKYSFLGSLRAAAQTISYEVMMILILMFSIFSLSTLDFNKAQDGYMVMFLFIPILLILFSSLIAETNRAPFDFAEGESELVSSFNVEFSGGLFTLLFLAEYSNILFMSVCTITWYAAMKNSMLFCACVFTTSMFFLVVRGVYPRFRYDLLMMLCWKSFLPFSLCMLTMVVF